MLNEAEIGLTLKKRLFLSKGGKFGGPVFTFHSLMLTISQQLKIAKSMCNRRCLGHTTN